jgi:hypothetical protein
MIGIAIEEGTKGGEVSWRQPQPTRFKNPVKEASEAYDKKTT